MYAIIALMSIWLSTGMAGEQPISPRELDVMATRVTASFRTCVDGAAIRLDDGRTDLPTIYEAAKDACPAEGAVFRAILAMKIEQDAVQSNLPVDMLKSETFARIDDAMLREANLKVLQARAAKRLPRSPKLAPHNRSSLRGGAST